MENADAIFRCLTQQGGDIQVKSREECLYKATPWLIDRILTLMRRRHDNITITRQQVLDEMDTVDNDIDFSDLPCYDDYVIPVTSVLRP